MKLDLLIPVLHQRLDLGVEDLSHIQQAADAIGLVDQRDLVAADSRDAGSLATARAGADDDHVLLLLGRMLLGGADLDALPHMCVDGALARLADEDVVQAARAHDARTNLLGMTGGNLLGGVRVGDELTAHAHSVAVALVHNLVAHVERVDAGAGEDGLVGDRLDLLGQIDELAFGHDLVCNRARSLMEAGLDRPCIDAVLLDDRHKLEGILDAVAAGHEVVGGDADEDRHISAAGLMDLVDDLGQEASAVLSRSAVLIGTMVGVLGQEAHDHVADACVDLDDVDAGILAALGGCAVLIDHDRDLFLGVLALGHADERTAHDVLGRSIGQQRIVARGAPLIAELQLSGDLGAMSVAHIGNALEPGNELVVPDAASTGGGVILRRGVEAVAHVGRTDFNKADTALSALLVEVHQVVGDMVVVHLLDGHRQHNEAILQLHIADLEGLQKFLVLCHSTAPFRMMLVSVEGGMLSSEKGVISNLIVWR